MGHGKPVAEIKHLNRQIPPEAHTAMYVWHKYWSRKTWNVVGEFIRTYCPENGVVFDPFAGSGVVAIEAVRSQRRAIVCDFNPAAALITELTIRPVDPIALQQAYERVQSDVKAKVEALYQISCTKCGGSLIAECCVRKGDKLVEVRYPKCPHCGHRSIGDEPAKKDVAELRRIEASPVVGWYPKSRLYYPDASAFKKKEKYESVV